MRSGASMSEPEEEIIVVPFWKVMLPLTGLWSVLGLLALLAGYMRGLS